MSSLTRNERWILSEWWVAWDRVQIRKEVLLAHRIKTPFAEVDLLTKISQPGEAVVYHMIEVKTWNRDIWGSEVISGAQVRRLQKAQIYFQTKFRRPVVLNLAVVKLNSALGSNSLCGTDRSDVIQYFDELPHS